MSRSRNRIGAGLKTKDELLAVDLGDELQGPAPGLGQLLEHLDGDAAAAFELGDVRLACVEQGRQFHLGKTQGLAELGQSGDPLTEFCAPPLDVAQFLGAERLAPGPGFARLGRF